jgi:NAD(P)-dependent dehydrogenase (short-subunit alcohol dehydrogenase family)
MQYFANLAANLLYEEVENMDYVGFDKNFSLNGKVAVVTGAAKGIGKAICEMFAQKGASVIMVDLSPEVGEVASAIRYAGGSATAVTADITDFEQLKEVMNVTLQTFGKINVLVNNAGIGPLEPAESMSIETFDKTLAVDLRAPFQLSQLVAQEMIKAKKGGKIINMASQAGIVAIDGHVAYSTSKAGIIGMTKAFALELGEYGINVNAISPTVTLTDLAKGYWVGEVAQVALSKTPIGRFANPDEVAAVAMYLASDASNMITGANIVIDGGYTIN